MNLRSLLFWRKKPTVESVSTAVAVRNALHVCIDDYEVTSDQFEELYCAILESVVYGRRDAAGIINEFIQHYDLKRTPESIARYNRLIKGCTE